MCSRVWSIRREAVYPLNLVRLRRAGHFGQKNAAPRKSGIGFRSELPDNAATDENIVLAALARTRIELRHTRPEVSSLTAQAEVPEDLYIESEACLEYAYPPMRPRA